MGLAFSLYSIGKGGVIHTVSGLSRPNSAPYAKKSGRRASAIPLSEVIPSDFL